MLQVQTFATITNLLLVLSKSIFWAIHCKHHSWSTCTTRFFVFYPRIFVHHYKENHTWIHYIHTWIHYINWYAIFSTNLKGVHVSHGGSTTYTTTHATLQTLGIHCGPLHSSNFKEMLRPLNRISKALPHLIRNISSISQMGISWNLIWLSGLRDIID